MNKFLIIILAILGGINAVVSMLTPIVLVMVWIRFAGLQDWQSYLFFSLGLLATLFRAIQIGFLKG